MNITWEVFFLGPYMILFWAPKWSPKKAKLGWFICWRIERGGLKRVDDVIFGISLSGMWTWNKRAHFNGDHSYNVLLAYFPRFCNRYRVRPVKTKQRRQNRCEETKPSHYITTSRKVGLRTWSANNSYNSEFRIEKFEGGRQPSYLEFFCHCHCHHQPPPSLLYLFLRWLIYIDIDIDINKNFNCVFLVLNREKRKSWLFGFTLSAPPYHNRYSLTLWTQLSDTDSTRQLIPLLMLMPHTRSILSFG